MKRTLEKRARNDISPDDPRLDRLGSGSAEKAGEALSLSIAKIGSSLSQSVYDAEFRKFPALHWREAYHRKKLRRQELPNR